MKFLILGGTKFVGRHITAVAVERGHRVTLFHRGQTGAKLFPDVRRIFGDRNQSLHALQEEPWDAIIDTCGYIPRLVRNSARLAADVADHYTFISTISVYASYAQADMDESAPLTTWDGETEEVNGNTYGPLKVRCEQEVEQAMPGRNTLIRPGLVVGPHDPTDRFSYWPWRFDRDDDHVLVPGRPNRPIQYIDVRDLAEWTVTMTERKETGIYNAVTPPGIHTMNHLIQACAQAGNRNPPISWVADRFLVEQGVQPWTELPLWIPEGEDSQSHRHLMNQSGKRARKAGLSCRPLEETVRDTLAWLRTRSSEHQWQAGLAADKEQMLLKEWKDWHSHR